MTLKEKLIAIKENLESIISEESAELEDHLIDNNDIYRLHYVSYYKDSSSDTRVVNWPCPAFMLPENMSMTDAFKVLSYLTDQIEQNNNIELSLQSVNTLNELIDDEKYGFRRVKKYDIDKVVDLYTIDGQRVLFKKSKEYNKYFEWYTPGITKEEVESIYHKVGLEFTDISSKEEKSFKTI